MVGRQWSRAAATSTNDPQRYLGCFDDEKEAARAYEAKHLVDNPIVEFLSDGSLNPASEKHIAGQSVVHRQQLEGK